MSQDPEIPDSSRSAPPGRRLLDLVRDAIRRRHYSRRTEDTCVHWIRRFIYFSGKRHPATVGAAEVTAFLNHLVSDRHVASSTQNQALAALLFLYRQVLGQALPWLDHLDRAKRPVRLPVVLTEGEVRALLAELHGSRWLMASLLYGSGLRLRECLMLRVKDVDFSYHQVIVRESKGGKAAAGEGRCRSALSHGRETRSRRAVTRNRTEPPADVLLAHVKPASPVVPWRP